MSIQAVIQNISDLNAIHLSLLALGEQKRQVLIRNNVDELTKIIHKESKLMKQVNECEQQWLDSIVQFLTEKGYQPNPEITVSELAKMVFHIEEKQSLLDSQSQLMQTISQLSEVNALNQQLIEQSLAFIDYSLDLASGASDDEAVYHNPRKQVNAQQKRSGLFDTRA